MAELYTKRQNLELKELKAFADDKINVTQILQFVLTFHQTRKF